MLISCFNHKRHGRGCQQLNNVGTDVCAGGAAWCASRCVSGASGSGAGASGSASGVSGSVSDASGSVYGVSGATSGASGSGWCRRLRVGFRRQRGRFRHPSCRFRCGRVRVQRRPGEHELWTPVTLLFRFVVTSVTGGLICCHESTKFAAGFTLDVPAGHRRKTARPVASYSWTFPSAAPAGSERHTPSRRGGYQTLYSCDTRFELLRHQCHYRRNLLSLGYKVPRPHIVSLRPGLFQRLGEAENPVHIDFLLRLARCAFGLAHSNNEAKPNFVLS